MTKEIIENLKQKYTGEVSSTKLNSWKEALEEAQRENEKVTTRQFNQIIDLQRQLAEKNKEIEILEKNMDLISEGKGAFLKLIEQRGYDKANKEFLEKIEKIDGKDCKKWDCDMCKLKNKIQTQQQEVKREEIKTTSETKITAPVDEPLEQEKVLFDNFTPSAPELNICECGHKKEEHKWNKCRVILKLNYTDKKGKFHQNKWCPCKKFKSKEVKK